MIDTTAETILPLTQAAGELPRRRRGRKTHVSTLYRWATVGCRGVTLETIQIGGTRCTSREALQRFFEALSLPAVAPGHDHPGPMGQRPPSRRRKASEQAGRELESMGA